MALAGMGGATTWQADLPAPQPAALGRGLLLLLWDRPLGSCRALVEVVVVELLGRAGLEAQQLTVRAQPGLETLLVVVVRGPYSGTVA